MSLYRWVHGKGALLDGIHELILETPRPTTRPLVDASVKAHANAFREALLAIHVRSPFRDATGGHAGIAPASSTHCDSSTTLASESGTRSAIQTVAHVVGHALSTRAHPRRRTDDPEYQALDADAFPMLPRPLGSSLRTTSMRSSPSGSTRSCADSVQVAR
jgi:hypothetical protein